MIVDDHALFRTGMKMILMQVGEAAGISEACSIKEAFDFSESGVDVILLDIHMPGLNGIAGIKPIRDKFFKVPIIVLSASSDINDMQNPEFISSWGVSDEDLFNQADNELSELNKSGKPFFSLVFTSSNHDPFDIPEGKVTLPEDHDPENVKRDLAIKYADYALGKFIAKAKTQDYWQDTVFLVVADHDVRVFGSEPVPLKSFHIPAVILNSDMDAKRDTRLVSQIDLPVTLLSLLGVEQATPMLGYDLTQQYPVERAMMQYYDNFAYVENGEAVILMPNQKVSYWRYDPASKTQVAVDKAGSNLELAKKALAHVLFSNLAYTEQLYRLPNKS